MEEIYKYIIVIALSSVKLLLSLSLSSYYGFSKATIIILNLIGGSIGIVFFVTLSEWLDVKIKAYYKNKKKKKFTLTNRFIIKVKTHGGLYGLSLLTPLILSIPVGCFLSVRYFKHKRRIIVFMLISLAFWTVLFASFGGK